MIRALEAQVRAKKKQVKEQKQENKAAKEELAGSFAVKKKLKRAAKEIISFNLQKEKEEDTFVIDEEDQLQGPELTEIRGHETGDEEGHTIQGADDMDGTLLLTAEDDGRGSAPADAGKQTQ